MRATESSPGYDRGCIRCRQRKPWNTVAPVGSKASGFRGYRCWTCHLKHQRERRGSL